MQYHRLSYLFALNFVSISLLMVLMFYDLIGCPQSFGVRHYGNILYLEISLPLSHSVQNSKAEKLEVREVKNLA